MRIVFIAAENSAVTVVTVVRKSQKIARAVAVPRDDVVDDNPVPSADPIALVITGDLRNGWISRSSSAPDRCARRAGRTLLVRDLELLHQANDTLRSVQARAFHSMRRSWSRATISRQRSGDAFISATPRDGTRLPRIAHRRCLGRETAATAVAVLRQRSLGALEILEQC